MTDRELMQQALEALELLARCEHPLTKIQIRKPRDGGSIVTVYPHQVATDAAKLLRERLAQPAQQELEHDEHAPQCSAEEWLLRGILASKLRCWNRLTEDEANNLVAFVRGMPSKQTAQQEPVAWMYEWDGRRHLTFTDQRFVEKAHPHFNKSTPLYTSPPASKPLTDEMVKRMKENCTSMEMRGAFADGWLSAEAAHGIKGEA